MKNYFYSSKSKNCCNSYNKIDSIAKAKDSKASSSGSVQADIAFQ
jgi:hypothetical protein